MDNPSLIQVLEAILFIENKPIRYKELMQIMEIDASVLSQVILDLKEWLTVHQSALEILEYNHHISLKPKDVIIESLQNRYKALQEKKLTPTMFSVLGIIAYKGPLTKGEIDQIRGIDSSYIVKRLLQEGLIKLAGKKNVLGYPNLYHVSDDFFAFFNLSSLKDLPDIEEFKTLNQEKS